MKIWLPDDRTQIQIDLTAGDAESCQVYQERFTMTLKPIDKPSGFEKEEKDV